MQEVGHWLQSLELGAAIHFGSLSMVPLRAAGGADAGYLTLADALASRHARVTEVSDYGSVPELAFDNLSSEHDVLLLDGEELVGAKQNRVVNLTILVAAGTRIVIPVSCVEQGRWRHTTAEFATSDNALFAEARAAKMQQVSDSLQRDGSRGADQSDVWARVAHKARELGAESATSAMADIFTAEAARHGAYQRAFEAQPGQVGAVFVVHGTNASRLVGLELFDSSQTFARMFHKVLGSFAMEARSREAGAGTAQRKALDARRAAASLIRKLAACEPRRFKALGEGEDLRFDAPGVVGGGLHARGRLVHLAAFRHARVRARRAELFG
jgi:hypothetical protein